MLGVPQTALSQCLVVGLGFSRMLVVSPNVTSVHCFIQRFALCTKVLPAQLLACLKQVVKMIKFVKASALNTRHFKQLCEDLGSEHTSLLYHTEVRWLSRGNATKRLLEMKNEMLLLFKGLGHEYSKDLENDEFVQRLAYFSDIFKAFNIMNLSLQGRNGAIVDFVSKLGAFIRKLDSWKRNTINLGCSNVSHLSKPFGRGTQSTWDVQMFLIFNPLKDNGTYVYHGCNCNCNISKALL